MVLLLSDGVDESSKFSFEDALEYARRTGVSIYSIGLKIGGKDAEAGQEGAHPDRRGDRRPQLLRRERRSELAGIYRTIQDEIRSRYLIGYQSSNTTESKAFREVEVRVARPGLEVKTMRGVLPIAGVGAIGDRPVGRYPAPVQVEASCGPLPAPVH